MSATEVLSALDRIHGTVSVIGSMNADYTVTAQRLPGPGETITGGPLQLLPGGKSGNQAAAAARIGATVQMFGAVGSDSNADFLLGALGEAGVNTTHVRRVLGPSGTTVITVDATGENTIVYSPGSNAQVTVDYVESVRDALARSSVLGLCLESPIETVTAAARMCHEAGVKVLLNDSPFTPSLPAELVEASDILLVNEHEMVQLLGIDEPENDDWDGFDWNHALEAMRGFGFEQAIVTLGGDGSVVLDSTSATPIQRIAPVRVNAVDTTGCGDSFMGTVLACLLTGVTASTYCLSLSLLLAFAMLYPEVQLLLFFVIPIRVKYFGFFAAALWVFSFLSAPLAGKLSYLLSMLNVWAFFGPMAYRSVRAWIRREQWKRKNRR